MGSFSFVSFEALGVRAADTTSDVAGAEAALLQVPLVIVLGAPELLGRRDLGDDRPCESPALLQRRFGGEGGRFLLGRIEEDGRAVLPSDVRTLTVELRRVVAVPEHVEELV